VHEDMSHELYSLTRTWSWYKPLTSGVKTVFETKLVNHFVESGYLPVIGLRDVRSYALPGQMAVTVAPESAMTLLGRRAGYEPLSAVRHDIETCARSNWPAGYVL